MDLGSRRNESQGKNIARFEGQVAQETEGELGHRVAGVCELLLYRFFSFEIYVAFYHPLGNPASVRDHDVSRPQSVARYYITIRLLNLLSSSLDQSDMGASVGVVFDTDDIAFARFASHKVHVPQSSLMSSSSAPNRDASRRIPAPRLAESGGELSDGLSAPEMRRDDHLQVSEARRDGFERFVAIFVPHERVFWSFEAALLGGEGRRRRADAVAEVGRGCWRLKMGDLGA